MCNMHKKVQWRLRILKHTLHNVNLHINFVLFSVHVMRYTYDVHCMTITTSYCDSAVMDPMHDDMLSSEQQHPRVL